MMLKIIFYITIMCIWKCTLPQMVEGTKEADFSHPNPMVLLVPCRRCTQRDDLGRCRPIFGCDNDEGANNETTSDTEDDADQESGNQQTSKLTAAQQGHEIYKDLCLPCFQVDRFMRCRKIKGCVVINNTEIVENVTGVASNPDSQDDDSVRNVGSQSTNNVSLSTLPPVSLPNNTSDESESFPASSGTTLFVTDVPRLKTFPPSRFPPLTPASNSVDNATNDSVNATRDPFGSQDDIWNGTDPGGNHTWQDGPINKTTLIPTTNTTATPDPGDIRLKTQSSSRIPSPTTDTDTNNTSTTVATKKDADPDTNNNSTTVTTKKDTDTNNTSTTVTTNNSDSDTNNTNTTVTTKQDSDTNNTSTTVATKKDADTNNTSTTVTTKKDTDTNNTSTTVTTKNSDSDTNNTSTTVTTKQDSDTNNTTTTVATKKDSCENTDGDIVLRIYCYFKNISNLWNWNS